MFVFGLHQLSCIFYIPESTTTDSGSQTFTLPCLDVIHLPGWCKTHLRGQRVIDQDVWSSGVWSEGPDGPGSQQIPVILCLEELSQLLPALRKQNSHQLKVGPHIKSAGTLRRLVDQGVRGVNGRGGAERRFS